MPIKTIAEYIVDNFLYKSTIQFLQFLAYKKNNFSNSPIKPGYLPLQNGMLSKDTINYVFFFPRTMEEGKSRLFSNSVLVGKNDLAQVYFISLHH
jgi:hypothetical protein